MKSPDLFGLDISDNTIELVALHGRKTSPALGVRAAIEVPAGTIDRGTIYQPDTLVTTLKTVLARAFGTERGKLLAGVAMPENKVYSAVFRVAADLAGEMFDRAVYAMALDYFPVELRECIVDKYVVSRDKDQQEVLFVAMEEATVLEYAQVLARAGVTPLFFEPETIALGRAVVPQGIKEPVLIADIGARSTNLFVQEENVVRFTSNVQIGGNHLTSALETKLNISYPEAERLKREIGLDPSAEGGRVMLILQNPLAEIIEEIGQTRRYYQERYGKAVSAIVLAGGTSLTPSVSEYVASNFPGMSVTLGEPFRSFHAAMGKEPAELKRQSVLFSTSTGVALRALNIGGGVQVNLLPGAKASQTGVLAAVDKAKALMSSLFSMATRAKRSTAKKGGSAKKERTVAKKEEEKAPVEAVIPPVTAEPGPEDAVAPPAAEAPFAAAPPSVEAEPGPEERNLPPPAETRLEPQRPPAKPSAERMKISTLSDDSVLAQISPAITEAAAELDEESGSDVGAAPTPTNEELYREQLEGGAAGRASDDRGIYADHATFEEVSRAHEEAPKKRRGSRLLTFGLILLVAILFLAAAGGVYMFVSKGNTDLLPAKIAKLFGGAPAPAAPGEGAVTAAPSSVGITFVIGTAEQETAGDTPFVMTRMLETDVAADDTFPATGVGESVGGKAEGTIMVVNESGRSYTFVATTRFLTPDGVLFRMDKATFIRTDGETPVKVTADRPGAGGDVGPTTWTIPGLSADLQKVVYGRTDAAMTGGGGTTKVVSVDDLAEAKAALEEKLLEEAEGNFTAMLADGETLHGDLFSSEVLKLEAPQEGSAGAEFDMTLSERLRALVIPETEALSLLRDRLQSVLPAGEAAEDYDLGSLAYTVEAYDPAARTASVRVEAPVIRR